jgi:hypothetical protein
MLAPGAERSYQFLPWAQRLCLFHIAYEAKNFCDSVIHNDGVVFLVHHVSTGLLAVIEVFASLREEYSIRLHFFLCVHFRRWRCIRCSMSTLSSSLELVKYPPQYFAYLFVLMEIMALPRSDVRIRSL